MKRIDINKAYEEIYNFGGVDDLYTMKFMATEEISDEVFFIVYKSLFIEWTYQLVEMIQGQLYHDLGCHDKIYEQGRDKEVSNG